MAAEQEIGIGWQVGVASGWGTYGTNLAVELVRRGIAPALFFVADPLVLTQAQAGVLGAALARHAHWRAERGKGEVRAGFPILHALGDKLDFPPVLRALHGTPDIGVVFFESALIPRENIAIASRFAKIVTGSTWNADILKRHGFTNVVNCFQGVDLDTFAPGPKSGRFAGRFAIFSGGKLEYRKGQDLVVAAFKKFHARHRDALLVTAWHNPWPQAAQGLARSPHVAGPPPVNEGRLDVAGWLTLNGLPPDSFMDLGPLANTTTAPLLREVDVAVLPSRCEGGTNLVAMECMASGVPVILSRNTGHLDLVGNDNCYTLDFQIPMNEVLRRPDLDGWGESSIEEIVLKLEESYADRAGALRRAANAVAFMRDWSWSARVGKLLDALQM
ncbi:MAG: glycosyltransferase family 4 protein [Rhodospirillaceae bacterium]